MTTVIPQSELTKRAMDWICQECAADASPADTSPADLSRLIEAAAVRFNLGPLDVEFLERFYANGAPGGK